MHRSKRLVYSSVGDRTRFPELWLDSPQERTFDLWVTYYGDLENDAYSSHADRYFRRKGGKFQNFHSLCRQLFHEISAYDAVFLLDDDIEISTLGINRMFEIRDEYDLWIAQPAFLPRGVISHQVTAHIPEALLHFTNFIEMNAPLFSLTAIKRLYEYHDSRLLGWGEDYLYMWANGLEAKGRYAVVDAVPCVNPHPSPGQEREALKLGVAKERIKAFDEVASDLGLRQWPHRIHSVLYETAFIESSQNRRSRKSLHAYPSRSCRIEVIESSEDHHVCRVSGDHQHYFLNDSALTVLGLCDGARTVLSIVLAIRDHLDLRPDATGSLRQSVQGALNDFLRRGWIEFSSVPGASGTVCSYDADSPAGPGVNQEEVPRSTQVINLDYRTDRLEQIASGLDKRGPRNWTRLPAVDAERYDSVHSMLEEYDYKLHPKYGQISWFDAANHRCKAKTGCALSHLRALRSIKQSGEEGWHVILEDDSLPNYPWSRLLDNFADTLSFHASSPDMVVLGDRVGSARPTTGVSDRLGTDAYAVHSSAVDCLIGSLDFTHGNFHTDYSLDNHFLWLCKTGEIDIAVLANGPWMINRRDHGGSDIER